MKIRLNGIEKEFNNSQNLKEAIEKFCKDTDHIIAEVNGEIIRNLRWNDTILKEGDSVELVNFVGGG